MSTQLITIIGCVIIFIATILGSSLIFFFSNQINPKLSSIINGFSAGIMIAASVWGLIIPAVESSSHLGHFSFVPAIIGIILGSFLILLIDIILNLKHKHKTQQENKLTRFLIAFTIHNIPEGLAVGFSFGCALTLNNPALLASSLGLAVGIAIQNIPEGMAVALPVYKQTLNKSKSFLFGVLSGVVEPIFAVVGVFLATHLQHILPWLLAFSAGAMLFVSTDDLIPESKISNSHSGTWGFILGFIIMMILDIALG